ncbi:energy-coupling factor transporter transmembrane component T [Tropicimonas sp. TH_r6]|uniref:energy-coupling factor transporter transmembrane component T family protein n=1 Tax=Tropicimonas sp. TH_r6 TaxID=3082085 RepID=UPI0029529CC6|nr:energy-coupling factor transporter transmembrane component T [Tropicimonas sp. TH_r6]MDV7145764.1 energy-coupling factor transporter transmembrane component T [Tropicimonas sp. TH_r6]
MILPEDLRLRLVVAAGVVIILSPMSQLWPSLAYLGLILGLALSSGTALPWRRLLHLEAFLILLLITLPLTVPGTPMLRLWGLTASWEGGERAAVVALKVTASMLLLTISFAHEEPVRLGQALRDLRVPETLVRILLGVLRYLALIRSEFARLQDAMRLRSFRPRSNWHTWRSYGNLIGMLLLRATARADRVEEAMRMRGFDGRLPTTPMPAVQPRDWPLAGLAAVLALGLLIWDLT